MSPELIDAGALPDLEATPNQDDVFEVDSDAPWGRKADGSPRRKPGRPKGSVNSGGGTGRSNTKLETRVASELVDLSALLMFSPMAMLHVERRSDKTATALVQLANRYPRIKDAINAYLQSAAYKDLVMFVGGIPIAIAIDFGRLRPNSIIGKPFGMEDIYDECYQTDGSETKPEWNAEPRGLAADL